MFLPPLLWWTTLAEGGVEKKFFSKMRPSIRLLVRPCAQKPRAVASVKADGITNSILVTLLGLNSVDFVLLKGVDTKNTLPPVNAFLSS